MFSKVVVLYFLTFFSILTAAAPGGSRPQTTTTQTTPTVTVTATPPPPTVSQCNTGAAQCCNTVESASSPGVGLILGLIGLVVQDVTGLVGLGCAPITILGLGQGASCAQQPVCCQNNDFNGLVNIGCTPISV